MAYQAKTWTTGELVTAEALNGLETAVAATSKTVDQIRTVNVSAGRGVPTHSAPAGIIYMDITTGDLYESDGA